MYKAFPVYEMVDMRLFSELAHNLKSLNFTNHFIREEGKILPLSCKINMKLQHKNWEGHERHRGTLTG